MNGSTSAAGTPLKQSGGFIAPSPWIPVVAGVIAAVAAFWFGPIYPFLTAPGTGALVVGLYAGLCAASARRLVKGPSRLRAAPFAALLLVGVAASVPPVVNNMVLDRSLAPGSSLVTAVQKAEAFFDLSPLPAGVFDGSYLY